METNQMRNDGEARQEWMKTFKGKRRTGLYKSGRWENMIRTQKERKKWKINRISWSMSKRGRKYQKACEQDRKTHKLSKRALKQPKMSEMQWEGRTKQTLAWVSEIKANNNERLDWNQYFKIISARLAKNVVGTAPPLNFHFMLLLLFSSKRRRFASTKKCFLREALLYLCSVRRNWYATKSILCRALTFFTFYTTSSRVLFTTCVRQRNEFLYVVW